MATAEIVPITPAIGAEVRGDTLFANMYLAYELLSEPVRRMLVDLTPSRRRSSRT